MILIVKVTPNAPKNRIDGFVDGVLKVKIQAPPDKGKANEELVDFLAEEFGIAKSRIEVVSGHTSRLKKLKIDADISHFLSNSAQRK